MLVAVVQVATRGSEFALGKPGRETIYTRVQREWRYKAKAFIDTAIYRGGDLVNGWIMAGIVAIRMPLGEVAIIGLVVACVWALLGWRVGRTHDEHLAAGTTAPALEANARS